MATKNKLNYFGLLALIMAMVTIVMVLAACSDGSDSEKGTETLTLSGQVYEREVNEGLRGVMGLLASGDLNTLDPVAIAGLMGVLAGNLISYDPINGNMAISDGGIMGGTGKIENGKLSYSITKPADAMFVSAADLLGEITQMLGGFLADESLSEAGLPALSGLYANARISPANTQVALLNLEIKNSDDYILIDRELITNTFSLTSMSMTITVEGVGYVYVDKKATITATGTSIPNLPIMGIPVNLTLPNIKLNLKKGWNALGVKVTITAGMSSSLNISGKVDYSCRQPSEAPASLNWVANPPTPIEAY